MPNDKNKINMKTYFWFISIILLSKAFNVRSDRNLFLTIISNSKSSADTSLQGPKGDIGPQGTCQCDQEEINRRMNILSYTEDMFRFSKEQTTLFRYKQNPDSCSVGLKTGKLSGNAITASSFISDGFEPDNARLDNTAQDGGAWIGATKERGEWIEVNMGVSTYVTGIITQGRAAGDDWITSFYLLYGSKLGSWDTFIDSGEVEMFSGNYDRSTYKINLFANPIEIQYLRLQVVSYNNNAALRMEVLTC